MALVRIPDGADVAVPGNELLHEPDLLLVHVLVLVDGHPAPAPAVSLAQCRFRFQRVRGPNHEIVEVAQVAGLHRVPVCLDHVSGDFLRRRPAGALRVRNVRQPAACPALRDTQGVPKQFDPLGLRRDPEAPLEAGRIVVLGQQGETQGVKRVDRGPAPTRPAAATASGRASRRRPVA